MPEIWDGLRKMPDLLFLPLMHHFSKAKPAAGRIRFKDAHLRIEPLCGPKERQRIMEAVKEPDRGRASCFLNRNLLGLLS